MNPIVDILKKTPQAKTPKRFFDGDAGYDLFVSRPTIIKPLSFCDVHTDICIKLPEEFWIRITGRSSTLKQRQLIVVEGVIDTGYTGELYIGVFNMSNQNCTIKSGERLAQILFHKRINVGWNRVDWFPENMTQRSQRGFGSTGK